MKFGVYLPNFGPFANAQVLSNLAIDAENSGWDGFFIWDHIAGPITLPMVDPWVALALIAIRTNRIRIGPLITPIPRRRPWKLARETVSIDRLSGGRLILGVGIGAGKKEWDALGEQTDMKKRGAMLDEGLCVLVGLWSGEPFTFEGEYYHLKDACFQPRPLQDPRIPIWVGGVWPNKNPFQRAVKWDGAFPYFFTDTAEQELQELAESAAFIKRINDPGHPIDIVCTGVTPGDDYGKSLSIIKHREALGFTWWLELITPERFNRGFEEEWDVESLRERIQQGPPSERVT